MGRTRTLKITSIFKSIDSSRARVTRKHGVFSILTTTTLANWMVKVGTTSKSDVTQKEKKP